MATKSVRLLLWVAVIGLVITVAIIVAVALLVGDDEPMLASEPRWLHVKIGATLKDAPGGEGLFADTADLPPLSTELAMAIRDAARDDEVPGLLVEVSGASLGWGQLWEIRDALAAFEAAGKPCVAWSDNYGNREYFLASACREIHLAPAGNTLVNGLELTQTYYAGTFDMLGISPNFEHVGDFKSAVEPYERTGPSEAAAEATNALLDSLYGQLVSAVARGRGIPEEDAAALVDDPPMTPADAVERGLVDELSYWDELYEDRFDGELRKARRYVRDRRREWSDGGSEVVVIHAEGTIIRGESGQEMFGGSYIGDRTLREQLKDAREDDDVAAVVLRINSPGGDGGASDAIWREVTLTRDEKPVVVSMADYAASGGYYVAAGAGWIVAEPTTLTGSIGVFGGKLNLSGLYGKLGFTTHSFARGSQAALFSSVADFDDAGREKYRGFLESFYQTFLERAAQGRGLSTEEVHEVAQGRVWTGEQALERRLVDELGGLDVAIAKAEELAAVEPGDHLSIRRVPERLGFFDQLMEELSNPSTQVATPLPAEATDALAGLVHLERVLKGGGVAAMLPGAPALP